jgi:hypothetical protein
MKKLYWKTIPEDFTSHGHTWEVNKWFKVDGEIKCCENGFHCSPTIFDATAYVTPGWICRVEVRGDFDDGGDKLAFREMRIIKRVFVDEKMTRKIAIYAAELVLPIYEKEYPNDNRPRTAIETAKRYSQGKATEGELSAAWDAARDAARAAAWAAAWAAARAAAWDAARAAAWDAAWDAAIKKIESYIKRLCKFNKWRGE